VFEPSTKIPGPLFSERAPTLGRGRFNLSVGYSYIGFDDFDGTSLNNIRSPGLIAAGVLAEAIPFTGPGGIPLQYAPLTAARVRTQINLNAHVIVPTLRYGLTDYWDISLSIPIIDTFLRVKNSLVYDADADFNEAGLLFTNPTRSAPELIGAGVYDRNGNPLDLTRIPFVKSRRPATPLVRAAGSSTGVGDITLRNKYQVWDTNGGGATLGLNLQFPSGDADNFHGTGDTHVSPFIYFSQVIADRVEPRINMGVDLDADDVDRSSYLYAVGATLLVVKGLGVSIDFLGRYQFSSPSIDIPPDNFYNGRVLNRPTKTCTAPQPCFLANPQQRSVSFLPFFPLQLKQSYPVDFSFGLRYGLGTRGSVFFGGIVPINHDGLRSDFIPSGGIEYTF
jgi:hypothetical protein